MTLDEIRACLAALEAWRELQDAARARDVRALCDAIELHTGIDGCNPDPDQRARLLDLRVRGAL